MMKPWIDIFMNLSEAMVVHPTIHWKDELFDDATESQQASKGCVGK